MCWSQLAGPTVQLSQADTERPAEGRQLDHIDAPRAGFALAYKRLRLADSLGNMLLAQSGTPP
jgi:hypothetical protein